MKSIFKKILKNQLSNFLCKVNPLYRKIVVMDDKCSKKFKEISSELKKIDINNKLYIHDLDKKFEENSSLKENIKKLEKIVYPEKNNAYLNLNYELVKYIEHSKQKIEYFNLKIDSFFNEMKKFILRTNILIDIGCGIRPEIFFEPSVHICIEPFKQYRDIIKPYFPNKSNVVFVKTDALEGLKNFDDNSVDSIFMIDLIEHLTKEDGLKLIKESDRVARKQIVIFTPLGFYPMFYKKNDKDAWGLSGTNTQEHKSGWTSKDFDNTWDFYVCKNCHEAFLPEEKAINKKYSAMMAIKTKKFNGFPEIEGTPDFVKNLYKERIEK